MTQFIMPQDNTVVSLSDSAKAHFKNIASGKIVKFGVEGGSCAGLKYSWALLENHDQLFPDDDIIEYDGFTFAIDGMSLLYLIGCEIDYVSDITGSRIEIINPNARTSCGCGESFSAA